MIQQTSRDGIMYVVIGYSISGTYYPVDPKSLGSVNQVGFALLYSSNLSNWVFSQPPPPPQSPQLPESGFWVASRLVSVKTYFVRVFHMPFNPHFGTDNAWSDCIYELHLIYSTSNVHTAHWQYSHWIFLRHFRCAFLIVPIFRLINRSISFIT